MSEGTKLEVSYETWRAMKRVVAASMCIKHWHDTMYNPETKETEGMIVSSKHVYDLWDALKEYEKAIR